MLEILEFIFSSFWRWLGATIMLYVTFPLIAVKHGSQHKREKNHDE